MCLKHVWGKLLRSVWGDVGVEQNLIQIKMKSKKKRLDNPGIKINDAEALKWTWASYEALP